MHVGLWRQGQRLRIRHARRPRSLQLAITLPGWIRLSVISGHAVGFRWLLREPGKDNTDLALLVSTWLTCYRCGFNAVVIHIIINSRAFTSTPRSSRTIRHEDGRRKSARAARGVRRSRFTPLFYLENPYPANVLQLVELTSRLRTSQAVSSHTLLQ